MIISIDPFHRATTGVQGNYDLYMQNIRKYAVDKQCYCISAYSHIIAPLLINQFPFILIDGDHNYTAVTNDLNLYMPKVSLGGIVCIHDNDRKEYPEVYQAIKDYLKQNKNYTILINNFCCIIQRSKS